MTKKKFNSVILSLTICFFASVLTSCSDKIVNQKVECSGTCDNPTNDYPTCSKLSSQDNSSVGCSCSGCVMTISTYSGNGSIKSKIKVNNFNPFFLSDFDSYMSKKYPNSNFSVTSIEIQKVGENFSELYNYKIQSGEIGTVMFARKKPKGEKAAKAKKFVIDCVGLCGCKESYNLNSGTAACSCADCQMIVTEI